MNLVLNYSYILLNLQMRWLYISVSNLFGTTLINLPTRIAPPLELALTTIFVGTEKH